MTTPQKIENNWEEELHKILNQFFKKDNIQNKWTILYSFISQLLESEKKKAYDEGQQEGYRLWDKDMNIKIKQANQEGYEQGRLKCLKRHRGQELKHAENQARQAFLEELVEEIERLKPTKPYPNANNGYQKDFDNEDKIIYETLEEAIKKLKEKYD